MSICPQCSRANRQGPMRVHSRDADKSIFMRSTFFSLSTKSEGQRQRQQNQCTAQTAFYCRNPDFLNETNWINRIFL